MYYVEAEGVILGYCENLAVAVKLARRHAEVFNFAVEIKVAKTDRLAASLAVEDCDIIEVDVQVAS